MKHDTTNEACKHTKSIKYGGRRRQCVLCRATWRVRSKRRGPKAMRCRVAALKKTFVQKLTLAQQAARGASSVGAFTKRHAASLAVLSDRPWPHKAPSGTLILVMDAMWFRKNQGMYTVYLFGLRSVHRDDLHFLRPILRYGYESQQRWREIIALIPEAVNYETPPWPQKLI